MQLTVSTTTTAGEHQSIPLYNKATAVHYGTEGVYMNHTPGGHSAVMVLPKRYGL